MPSNTPPDPSAPDKFNAAVDARVRAILSDPLRLPDPFVSWMTQTINAYTISTPDANNTLKGS